MRNTTLAALAALLMCTAPLARAQDAVVIYRCTDAQGALTVQNGEPCPAGSKQDKRVVESVASSAGFPPPTPAAAPPPSSFPPMPPADAASTIPSIVAGTPDIPSPSRKPLFEAEARDVADDRLPPPVLFECRTWDKQSYLSENETQPERCVPLSVTGLDGNSGGAGGSACQLLRDQCQRVPDEALCEKWGQRLKQAESAARFGREENEERAKSEAARLQRIMKESTCAG